MLYSRMLNATPVVIEKKITKELHVNKWERSFKCFTTENQLNTKEDSNAENERQKRLQDNEKIIHKKVEEVFKINISKKVLMFRIYKNILQINKNRTENPFFLKNQQKIWTGTS